jgi:hypothetical protein
LGLTELIAVAELALDAITYWTTFGAGG